MNQQQFRTTNFYLAAYLLAEGMKLLDIDRSNPRRSVFVFAEEPKREDLVHNYNFGQEALVDARKYSLILKELKSKLYMDNN